MYKLTYLREKRNKDLNLVKCIKNYFKQPLTGDNEIKERWRYCLDRRIHVKVNDKFCRIVARPALLFGSECCAAKIQQHP